VWEGKERGAGPACSVTRLRTAQNLATFLSQPPCQQVNIWSIRQFSSEHDRADARGPTWIGFIHTPKTVKVGSVTQEMEPFVVRNKDGVTAGMLYGAVHGLVRKSFVRTGRDISVEPIAMYSMELLWH